MIPMDRPRLIYVFDALCGWCYAFGFEVEKIMNEFGSEVDPLVINGGLVLGDRVGTFDETYPQIHDSVKQLEQYTGHSFGSAFKEGVLKNTADYVLDSEIPSRAMVIFRDHFPERQIEISHILQKAFYLNGRNISNQEVLADIAEEMGMDRASFLLEMNEESYRLKTLADFQTAQKMGISGFPALAIQIGEKGYLLARGYRPADEIIGTLRELMVNQSRN
ncbi:MAG: DsbA family protein, partial [Bacteroidota bacterium]|nr:DsbA family protein [Bacteroidota bacterium]MDX5505305.1 DsbA family protein [Bacteroidota bacterium]